ncbi:hypothetical protein O9992_15765 [Vibrio lentus]|nr:hypothetical protein [Vibrio lentus]
MRSTCSEADLVIGAVLTLRAAAPKLVTKKIYIAKMKPGSAVVDVAIDQGGCFELHMRQLTLIQHTSLMT